MATKKKKTIRTGLSLRGQMIKSPGVYVIENTVNGKKYVGSTANLAHRWKSHLYNLRHGCHANQHLQASFSLYGEDAFRFIPVLACEESEQLRYEQALIDLWKPEYNIRIEAHSNKGLKASEETRKKLSQIRMGHPNYNHGRPGFDGHTHTDATKAKISASKKANMDYMKSPEYRKKLSEAVTLWWKERKEGVLSQPC